MLNQKIHHQFTGLQNFIMKYTCDMSSGVLNRFGHYKDADCKNFQKWPPKSDFHDSKCIANGQLCQINRNMISHVFRTDISENFAVRPIWQEYLFLKRWSDRIGWNFVIFIKYELSGSDLTKGKLNMSNKPYNSPIETGQIEAIFGISVPNFLRSS